MIICVANEKGGVSKTTTCHALSTGLIEKGYKVLLVDLDPQSNLTYIMGVEDDAITAYEVLLKKHDIREAIQTTPQGDILPSSGYLSNASVEFISVIGKEHKLKEALHPIEKKYDYIIIDTPPGLGLLTVQALTACDGLVIPAQADIFSLQGIGNLYETISTVRQYTNKKLKILGILLTKYSNRTNLSKEITEMLDNTAKKLSTKIFTTTIRDSVAIRETQAMRESIYIRSPKNAAVEDYRRFIDELLNESEN